MKTFSRRILEPLLLFFFVKDSSCPSRTRSHGRDGGIRRTTRRVFILMWDLLTATKKQNTEHLPTRLLIRSGYSRASCFSFLITYLFSFDFQHCSWDNPLDAGHVQWDLDRALSRSVLDRAPNVLVRLHHNIRFSIFPSSQFGTKNERPPEILALVLEGQ